MYFYGLLTTRQLVYPIVFAFLSSLYAPLAIAQTPEDVDISEPVRQIVLPAESRVVPIQVRAVFVTAKGCGTCKILTRNLSEVMGTEAIAGLDFAELDFSKKDEDRFYGLASALEIETAIKEHVGKKLKAGTLLLIDVENQRVISEINHKSSSDEILQQFKNAVATQ